MLGKPVRNGDARMVKKPDLSKMSIDELKALKKDVESAIDGFAERKRAEAFKAIQEVAKKHGMSVDEIVGKSVKRKAKSVAKYANPENASQTWSGRGRQPAWFKAAMVAGKDPASMEI